MTGSSVRVFIAVTFPGTVKVEMGKLIASIEALEVRDVRTVRVESLHLTMRFLGDTDIGDIAKIVSAMEIAASESEPFNLTLSGAGAFPNAASPRTLWVGVDGDLERLSTLQGGVQRALESAGFSRSRERFSPHVTIARVRNRLCSSQHKRVTAALDEAIPSPIPVRVDSIALMRSTPQPGGSIYTPIHTSPLGSRQ